MTMTQRQEEAEQMCHTFRETAEKIWRYYDSATMSLPYHYSNGIVATVRVKVMEDGRVYVSDNGRAAPNEGLTIQNVKSICRKHGLRYETIDEDMTMPLCCDMYRIVEKKDFVPAVWGIIEAILDARYVGGKKRG